MINVYNESNLHAILKKLYALEYEGQREVAIEQWICDIVTPKKEVIEIQTAHISKLTKKTQALLDLGYSVRIVHPLIFKKTIEVYDKDGRLLSRRKSPKQESFYTMLRSLTGIYSILTRAGLTLEVITAEVTEKRIKTSQPVQLKNKSRHYLRDWIPAGKELMRLTEKKCFTTLEDYERLLPLSLAKEFTISQLSEAISQSPLLEGYTKGNKKKAGEGAGLLVWLFTRMGILKECGKRGRSRLFTHSSSYADSPSSLVQDSGKLSPRRHSEAQKDSPVQDGKDQ